MPGSGNSNGRVGLSSLTYGTLDRLGAVGGTGCSYVKGSILCPCVSGRNYLDRTFLCFATYGTLYGLLSVSGTGCMGINGRCAPGMSRGDNYNRTFLSFATYGTLYGLLSVSGTGCGSVYGSNIRIVVISSVAIAKVLNSEVLLTGKGDTVLDKVLCLGISNGGYGNNEAVTRGNIAIRNGEITGLASIVILKIRSVSKYVYISVCAVLVAYDLIVLNDSLYGSKNRVVFLIVIIGTHHVLMDHNTVDIKGYGVYIVGLSVFNECLEVHLNADSVPAVKVSNVEVVALAVTGLAIDIAVLYLVAAGVPHLKRTLRHTALCEIEIVEAVTVFCSGKALVKPDAGKGKVIVSEHIHRFIEKNREFYEDINTILTVKVVFTKNIANAYALVKPILFIVSAGKCIHLCLGVLKLLGDHVTTKGTSALRKTLGKDGGNYNGVKNYTSMLTVVLDIVGSCCNRVSIDACNHLRDIFYIAACHSLKIVDRSVGNRGFAGGYGNRLCDIVGHKGNIYVTNITLVSNGGGVVFALYHTVVAGKVEAER